MQRRLAAELTTRVHGADVADRARGASEAVFYGSVQQLDDPTIDMLLAAVPSLSVDKEQSAPLTDTLVRIGAAASKAEVRRLGACLSNQVFVDGAGFV